MDVGIIGGADGPTAILVGGDPVGFIALLVLATGLVGAAVWFFRRKRTK